MLILHTIDIPYNMQLFIIQVTSPLLVQCHETHPHQLVSVWQQFWVSLVILPVDQHKSGL